MRTSIFVGLLLGVGVWVGWTEPRHRLQRHIISVSDGTRVVIEYPTQDRDDRIRYGNAQHLMVLKEAVGIVEAIVADERKKETR